MANTQQRNWQAVPQTLMLNALTQATQLATTLTEVDSLDAAARQINSAVAKFWAAFNEADSAAHIAWCQADGQPAQETAAEFAAKWATRNQLARVMEARS